MTPCSSVASSYGSIRLTRCCGYHHHRDCCLCEFFDAYRICFLSFSERPEMRKSDRRSF